MKPSISLVTLFSFALGDVLCFSVRNAFMSSRLYSTVETVTDIQEVVDALERMDENDKHVVRFRNEMTDTDITKEKILYDLEEIIEDALEIQVGDILEHEITLSAPSTANKGPAAKKGLASDIKGKLKFVEPERTPEEAAISASLYMNPVTEKIARHLKVTWEPEAAEMLSRLEKCSNPSRPFMVGIVGIPGSGKSTSAEIISAILGEDRAIVMPMDGFHIPLAELAQFENAADAIYRRGAPDTFHASTLAKDLTRIAYGSEPIVTIPGFDHAVGDPTPDQHTFDRNTHRIVICEGLYLLHDDHGWEDIKSFFDWTIYIDADVDKCVERLKERNKCIPGYTPEEIEIRCDVVDRKNAETSRNGAFKYASQIVKSGASS